MFKYDEQFYLREYETDDPEEKLEAVCGFAKILDEPNLSKILTDIKGASALVKQMQSDTAYRDRLIRGEFTQEDFIRYGAPFLNFLQLYFTPPGCGLENEDLADWFVVANYRESPPYYPKAEDFYKFREDLAIYNAWTKSRDCRQRFPRGVERTPNGLDELQEIAREHPNIHQENKILRTRYSEAMRKVAQEPHTVIYKGPAGKIIVPHTMAACQHWGNETRWCIAARDRENNAFHGYNSKAPIFIFIPKPTDEDRRVCFQYRSFKFAITDGRAYDEYDNISEDASDDRVIEFVSPPCLERLHQEALTSLAGGRRAYYEALATTDLYKRDSTNSSAEISDGLPDEWKTILGEIRDKGMGHALREYGVDLCRNSTFMLEAIRMDPVTFQEAVPALKKFPPFQREAIKVNPAVFCYMGKNAQKEMRSLLVEVASGGCANNQLYYVIHLLPDFFGGPLTADPEEIAARLRQSSHAPDHKPTTNLDYS